MYLVNGCLLWLVYEGGDSVVSASMLSESQSVNLLSVDFLCHLCQQTEASQHTECVIAELVKLIDCENDETWSCSKVFDVHLVSELECVCCLAILIVFFYLTCFVNVVSYRYFCPHYLTKTCVSS